MDLIVIICIWMCYMYWDHNYSRAAKVVNLIKENEPEVYSAAWTHVFMAPSSFLKGITGSGLYLKIQDKSIKDEVIAIDAANSFHAIIPWALFIGYLLFSLGLRAVSNG